MIPIIFSSQKRMDGSWKLKNGDLVFGVCLQVWVFLFHTGTHLQGRISLEKKKNGYQSHGSFLALKMNAEHRPTALWNSNIEYIHISTCSSRCRCAEGLCLELHDWFWRYQHVSIQCANKKQKCTHITRLSIVYQISTYGDYGVEKMHIQYTPED